VDLGEVISGITYDADDLEQQLESLANSVAQQPDDLAIQEKYDSILVKLEDHHPPRVHPQEVLETFNLVALPEETLVSHLSGGQKTRLGLSTILINDPDLIILDEPTNHLDIAILEWLEEWINTFPGGVLIVSHDRTFLDNTVNKVFDLDIRTHSIQQYQGNYSQYLEQFIKTQEKQLSAYRDQVYEIRKIKQDIAKTKNQAYSVEITTT
jgi:ATP-binding cassette subfamily F protein 3